MRVVSSACEKKTRYRERRLPVRNQKLRSLRNRRKTSKLLTSAGEEQTISRAILRRQRFQAATKNRSVLASETRESRDVTTRTVRRLERDKSSGTTTTVYNTGRSQVDVSPALGIGVMGAVPAGLLISRSSKFDQIKLSVERRLAA